MPRVPVAWSLKRSAKGAKAATGGRRMNRPGYFLEPTVLTRCFT
jgi:acyl-CoA reductase-like NAD-dependent aldehyde dehydrogenase